MVVTTLRGTKMTVIGRKPTEYLIGENVDQLDPFTVFVRAMEGFPIKNVEAMLSVSELYSSTKIMTRIVGKSVRTIQRQGNKSQRLTSQQSAVAFQYAKILEQATAVFGDQKLAEEWLSRPCKQLAGSMPLDLIDNSLGFQAVEDYLERIELGVYQ